MGAENLSHENQKIMRQVANRLVEESGGEKGRHRIDLGTFRQMCPFAREREVDPDSADDDLEAPASVAPLNAAAVLGSLRNPDIAGIVGEGQNLLSTAAASVHDTAVEVGRYSELLPDHQN